MKKQPCEPRSEEWYQLRVGIPCTSGFQYIITPTGAPTTGERRMAYMHRLIAERMLGYSMEKREHTYWTERGGELEPAAAAAFARQTGYEFEDGSVFITNDAGTLGCSPDYLIKPHPRSKRRQALEIKCKAPWNHVGYLLEGPGREYRQQVQGQLWVGEFDVVHFWAYHPQMPPCWMEVKRDEEFIARLQKEVGFFLRDLEAETRRCREMGTFIPGREHELVPDELPGVFPWRGDLGELQ
jgi:YqaJ-like viral recombinase domain